MGRQTIKVCVRTRPTANYAQEELIIDKNAITVMPADDSAEDSVLHNKQNNFKFNFHHVLHNAGQDTVYETLARDCVQGTVDGINGTIMTYGQTGSGKTFTMMGDTQNYQHRGIAPRALSHIFQEVAMRIETQFTISCSYMEIYNERIFDLLADMSAPEARTEYTIAEEKPGRGTFVRGLTETVVTSETEALNLLFSGELSRTTAPHKLNKRSNRSHSIFTIYVQQRSRSGVSERVITSKLNLVDLAGSERLKKTLESGGSVAEPLDDTLKKESMCINQSLTYLEQCVVALSRKSSAHVPYRQTKLTNVLKDSLGGNCNTLMFSCIWGESAHLEETISTLRLAQRMMRVQNDAATITVTDPVKMVKKQERVIKELKQELLMHDALSDRSGVVYDEYTPEQREALRKQLDKFLAAEEGDEDEALGEFHSVRQMREICKVFKGMFQEQAEQTRRLVTAASTMEGLGGTMGATDIAGLTGLGTAQGAGDDSKLVGDAEDTGFGLGLAADSARPMTTEAGAMGSRMGSRAEAKESKDELGGGVSFDSPMAEAKSGPMGGSTMASSPGMVDMSDRDQAYQVFIRSDVGRRPSEELKDCKARLKELRGRYKACANSINASKGEIDELTDAIQEKKIARERLNLDGEEDIVDEEEFRLMKRQREAKKVYRTAYQDLNGLKADLEATTKETEACKFALLNAFEDWYASGAGTGAFAGTGMLDTMAGSMGSSMSAPHPDDKLDDQEQFDKMEIDRVVSQDPDALAFFQAQKTKRATATQNHVAIKQAQKNKRSW